MALNRVNTPMPMVDEVIPTSRRMSETTVHEQSIPPPMQAPVMMTQVPMPPVSQPMPPQPQSIMTLPQLQPPQAPVYRPFRSRSSDTAYYRRRHEPADDMYTIDELSMAQHHHSADDNMDRVVDYSLISEHAASGPTLHHRRMVTEPQAPYHHPRPHSLQNRRTHFDYDGADISRGSSLNSGYGYNATNGFQQSQPQTCRSYERVEVEPVSVNSGIFRDVEVEDLIEDDEIVDIDDIPDVEAGGGSYIDHMAAEEEQGEFRHCHLPERHSREFLPENGWTRFGQAHDEAQLERQQHQQQRSASQEDYRLRSIEVTKPASVPVSRCFDESAYKRFNETMARRMEIEIEREARERAAASAVAHRGAHGPRARSALGARSEDHEYRQQQLREQRAPRHRSCSHRRLPATPQPSVPGVNYKKNW